MAVVVDYELYTTSSTWILGLLGISIMAFLLGCTSCRQNKTRGVTERRSPPPTPEPQLHPRYQTELYLPNPSSATPYSVMTREADNVNDYEDDFEEFQPTIPADQCNNVGSTRISRKDPVMRSSLESEGKVSSVSEDFCHSYENVAMGPSPANPVMKKDHTYLEVFPTPSSSDMDLEKATTAENMKISATRSSVESEGKVSTVSDNFRHSYENVQGSPSSAASALDGDYVNVERE
ncbi:uncharacterized protein [Hyperolius riggenbachi]|uniref:uncharacterized protein n=1 Tax=Hyperolius riggenbachi TaxID=752182 RepID=UPI0035A34C71